jgi:hypothetical protein
MVAAMDVPPVAAPEFPWPPPRASASIKIPTSLVLGQWGAPAGSPPPRRTSWQSYYYGEDVLLSLWQTGAPRLMHVDATLTTALSAAGYLEASYYSVPDGFALVTRLEQINPDGTPKPVPTRWEAQARLLEKFSLTGYCQALFSAKPGLFRIIVFVVTSHPFTESPEIVTREDAILWLCRGANVLPSALAKQHYSAEHTCTALIYEFEKLDVETEAKVTVPGRLAADVHIEKSGIWGGIQR